MLLSQPARKRALLKLLHISICSISNIRHRTINQQIPKHIQTYSSLPYGRLVLETLRFDNTLRVKTLVSSAEPVMTFDPWWRWMKASVIRNWKRQSTAPGGRVLLHVRLKACVPTAAQLRKTSAGKVNCSFPTSLLQRVGKEFYELWDQLI